MPENWTQLESARRGILTGEMRRVAVRENVQPEFILAEVARGRLVIPSNKRHLAGSGGKASAQNGSAVPREYTTAPAGHPGAAPSASLWVNRTVSQRQCEMAESEWMRGECAPKRLDPMGIGRMITTKVNANIGASPVASSLDQEIEKLHFAQRYGADTLMDLSTGGALAETRQALIDNSTIPIGTVPIYAMIFGRQIEDLGYDDILREIEFQARQGVDYFTIHAGILRSHLKLVRGRLTGIVSRGGSLLAKWMIHHGRENPMYELFDEISAIMREYDVTYSLGDGLRPGCLADACDDAQLAELRTMGELVNRARAAGVQTMVEGPGHVALDKIAFNMKLEQEVCDEHVGLPNADDVKQGCIAYRIAAHAGDVARGVAGARQWDDDLSRARAALNWRKQFELAFDGETARAYHDEDLDIDTDFCAMCGHDWCSMRISKEIEEFDSGKDPNFQPDRRVQRSPGFQSEARGLHKEIGDE
jgi:phosphomethylpyrimidine synthase